MLKVTDRAKEELAYARGAYALAPEQAFRIVAGPDNELGFEVDVQRPGDQVVEHDGVVVLLLDPILAEGLEGRTLDAEETDQGVTFTLA